MRSTKFSGLRCVVLFLCFLASVEYAFGQTKTAAPTITVYQDPT